MFNYKRDISIIGIKVISVEGTFHAESSSIVTEFHDTTKINIDTSGDVDLTEFVRKLTELIKDNCKLELIKNDLE